MEIHNKITYEDISNTRHSAITNPNNYYPVIQKLKNKIKENKN